MTGNIYKGEGQAWGGTHTVQGCIKGEDKRM